MRTEIVCWGAHTRAGFDGSSSIPQKAFLDLPAIVRADRDRANRVVLFGFSPAKDRAVHSATV
jgi:hypothetical protein